MSWKDQLKRFKADWDQFNAQHNILPGNHSQQQQYNPSQQQYSQQQYPQQQQQQQYTYNRPPPPPPYQYQSQSQSHYQPQQPQYNTPPQPPPHPSTYQTPPPPPHQPEQQYHAPNPIYWQPHFHPSVPIQKDWDAKLGNNNGWGNAELENYTSSPQNSFHTPDGKLIIRAISNPSHPDPAQQFTSARLVSRQTLSRDRGVLTAILTSACAPGIWPAFWLLPQEPFTWPTDGEIDIMETWNGDRTNHSCLHWGHYNGEDWNKHITQTTHLEHMPNAPVRYDFAWEQPNGVPGQGRMIWYIDGRPVMKALVPTGTRPLRDFNVLLNVAMGGNVCAGQRPRDGSYDLVVHWMGMSGEYEGEDWGKFGRDWAGAPDGKVG